MKDLYTFDVDYESAMKTYAEVRSAYSRFFASLKIPLLVAEASCGDMGGSKSHEYHMASHLGEDTTVRCRECEYTSNEEMAEVAEPQHPDAVSSDPSFSIASVDVWRGISLDRRTLVNAWYLPDGRSSTAINVHAVRSLVPDIDASIEDASPLWAEALVSNKQKLGCEPLQLVNLFDSRVSSAAEQILQRHDEILPPNLSLHEHSSDIQQSNVTKSPHGGPLGLMRIQDGDQCPRCRSGVLEVVKTLELGHTFHLGDRYSAPMKAMVTVPPTLSNNLARTTPMQMGCFGIGLSRIIGAVADALAREDGLMWPVSISPYEIAVVPDKGLAEEAFEVYDLLAGMTRGQEGSRTPTDVIMDDRAVSIAWKLKDADLTGYPIVVVLGRAWRRDRSCEVQCRSLSLKETVMLENLPTFIATLFESLG
ncbi:related to prolyl-tRNA synthetase [Cephalotrichum gorgonifer]|uniref:Related to prolyl-tRNA synthetase n=1 Tax=Cephalotrichum gorgonifer TaxID=2041049 RepID=A0AAE8N0H4_9PEZI|nr:related to prolyl-tRNA synthetase [Cephalotrichum gorgonifer]